MARVKVRRGKRYKVGGAGISTHGFRFKMDKGWKEYADAVEVKRFRRKLNREKKKAFDAIARDIIAKVIEGNNNFAPNAPLTLLLKQGNTPLKAGGKNRGLFKSISTKTMGPNKLFVGFTKSNKFYSRAKLLHDGGAIKVTHKMRMMFFALWMVSAGHMEPSKLTGRARELWKLNQEWYPLNEGTKAIKIPGRPFIEEAFKDPEVIKKARAAFIIAINRTIRAVARGRG